MTSKPNGSMEPSKPSLVHPSALSPPHMLSFTIGTYFQVFSQVEFLLSIMACRIMNVDIRTVQFLWRDAGLRNKTKGTRRAAKEAFGDKDERFNRINKVLVQIENRSGFRNDLAHGTFITHQGSATLGRAGESYQEMLANFDPIDAGSVLDELVPLQGVIKDLGALIASNFLATSNTSESKSSNQ